MANKTARTGVMNVVATPAYVLQTCSGAPTVRGMPGAWMRVRAATDSLSVATGAMNVTVHTRVRTARQSARRESPSDTAAIASTTTNFATGWQNALTVRTRWAAPQKPARRTSSCVAMVRTNTTAIAASKERSGAAESTIARISATNASASTVALLAWLPVVPGSCCRRRRGEVTVLQPTEDVTVSSSAGT